MAVTLGGQHKGFGEDEYVARRDVCVIHRLAHVQDSEIGLRTKVWQFASVIRGAMIGADCVIASNVLVDGAVIGDRCSLSHGAVLYPGTVLGDEVFVGPGVACCNDRWPVCSKEGFDLDRLLGGMVSVRIGNKVGIGAGAVILPGVSIGDGCMIAAGAVVSKSVPAGHLVKGDGSVVVPLDGRIPVRMREA